jgi:hypothetical protein
MDGMVKSNSDENQALAARTRRGRRGSPDRRGLQEEELLLKEKHPQSRDGRNILARSDALSVMTLATMLHSVHSGGEEEEGNKASTTKVDDIADRFQREILLVSDLSGTVSSRETWLVDNGASFHMTGARELFDTLTETGSDLCVELGMGAKHSV